MRLVFRRETAQRGLLIWKFLEYLRQVSDLKDFFDFCGEADDFHGAALLHNRDVDARELANAGAVEIAELAEIEQDVVAFFAQQNLYGIVQRGDFHIGKMAYNIDERNAILLADFYGKIHGDNLSRAGLQL